MPSDPGVLASINICRSSYIRKSAYRYSMWLTILYGEGHMKDSSYKGYCMKIFHKILIMGKIRVCFWDMWDVY